MEEVFENEKQQFLPFAGRGCDKWGLWMCYTKSLEPDRWIKYQPTQTFPEADVSGDFLGIENQAKNGQDFWFHFFVESMIWSLFYGYRKCSKFKPANLQTCGFYCKSMKGSGVLWLGDTIKCHVFPDGRSLPPFGSIKSYSDCNSLNQFKFNLEVSFSWQVCHKEFVMSQGIYY